MNTTSNTAYCVDDGFGNVWICKHGLTAQWCCLEVIRPGKSQCPCDSGLPALLEHHYERGKNDEWEESRYDDGWDGSGDW